MAGGRYELPKKSEYGFILKAPSVDFFSNTFFTGFTQNQTNTKYTGQTSIFSFTGKSTDAPSTDFFSNQNATGFTNFAKLGETKYILDSSNFTWKGDRTKAPAVNFFANINVSDGFVTNTQLYDTKFLNNSIFGNLGFVDAFSNQFSSGFTPRYTDTQFTATALDYGLKGFFPSTDFFSNRNAFGFTTFAKLGETKYILDSSNFTWKGNRNSAPTVNFFLDKNATGFTAFQIASDYITDSSIFTWKGSAIQAPEVNFFQNTNTVSGFTKFVFGQPTQFILDSSNFTWKGGKTNAPGVDFFFNTNAEGFKTFSKLYESYYKYDSTILHEIATTPAESARTGGATYKLNGQLIKSPLFNNLGFSAGAAKYTDVLKTRQFNSILGETANKRNSPSLLDIQYEKYDLTNDSFNPDYNKQPYILRGIQKPGSVENERWGASIALADGLIRGGALTAFNRTVADVKRITQFMTSAKGVGFIIKQVGLHLASQNQETDPTGAALNLGFNPVKIYNPVAQLLSVAGSPVGQHFTRHGLIPILSNNKYENAVKYRNENNTETFATILNGDGYQNRLLQLTKELLSPIADGYTLFGSIPAAPSSTIYALQKNKLQYATYYNNKTIDRLSYLTGPGSVYGIGATIVNRYSNSIPLKDTVHLYGYNVPYAPNYMHDHPNRVIPAKEPLTPAGPTVSRRIESATYNLQTLYTAMFRTAGAGGIFVSDDPALDNTTTEYRDVNPMYAQIKAPFSRTIGHNSKPALRVIKPGVGFTNKRLNRNTNVDPKLHQFSAHVAGNLDTTTEYNFKSEGDYQQDLIRTYATSDPLITNVKADTSLVVPVDSPIYKFSTSKIKDFRLLLGNVTPDTAGNGRLKLDTINVNGYPLQPKNSQALRAVFTNPKIINYEKNNLIDRFGFGDQGKVGLYRDNPTRTHRGMIGSNGEAIQRPRKFIGDRIQLIDFRNNVDTEDLTKIYERDGKNKYGFDGAEDLIEFYVSGPKRKDRAIVFRATINDIQDNFSPTYNTIKYLGRADPIYLYSAFERSVSVSFQIGITSRDELRSRWRSINALAAYTAPEYLKNGRMRAPLMKLTIGHLFRQTPVFINGLVYSFDNSQTTWETAKLEYDAIHEESTAQEKTYFGITDPKDPGASGVLQLPKFINVKLDLKIIGNYRPQLNGDDDNSPDMGIMYNLYDTADGALPPPGTSTIVNYFSDMVVVQPTSPEAEKKADKEATKKTATTSAPSGAQQPSRDVVLPPKTFPIIKGNVAITGEYLCTRAKDNPYYVDGKLTIPDGYVLVKQKNLKLGLATVALVSEYPNDYTIRNQPLVELNSLPNHWKIDLLQIVL
jgi:hypothetical protein